MTIRAVLDAGKLEKDIQTLIRMSSKQDTYGAMGRSLRRATQSMTKQATAEAQAVLNLKTGAVRDVVRVKRIRQRELGAEVEIKAISQPVIGFKGTRQGRKGVSVQINKGGARRVIAGSFIATLRSGHVDAFKRRRLPGGLIAGRLPIDVIRSRSVRQVLEDEPRQARILGAGKVRFQTEFQRELIRRLGAA